MTSDPAAGPGHTERPEFSESWPQLIQYQVNLVWTGHGYKPTAAELAEIFDRQLRSAPIKIQFSEGGEVVGEAYLQVAEPTEDQPHADSWPS